MRLYRLQERGSADDGRIEASFIPTDEDVLEFEEDFEFVEIDRKVLEQRFCIDWWPDGRCVEILGYDRPFFYVLGES